MAEKNYEKGKEEDLFSKMSSVRAPGSHSVNFVAFVAEPMSILTKKTWCPSDDPFFRSFRRCVFSFICYRSGGVPKCDFE